MKLLVHEELLERGYNVLPVGADKQPLTSRYGECYDRHCPELRKFFESHLVKKRQTGLALLGRVNPHFPEKILVIIDVDDPRRFPSEARRLLEGAWRWATGPRCPIDGDKHDISCQSPLPTATCRHKNHEFKLSEAARGEAYAVLVPAEAEGLVAGGVAKLMGGAVEIRIRGYQLIPPSLHPSGVIYEWLTSPWAGGGFRPPKELSIEEFRQLLELLGKGQETAQGQKAAPEGCRGVRQLSDRDIDSVLEVVKPYYLPGFRNAILYALLGVLRRRCYDPDSIRRFYDRLQAWAMSVYPDIDKKKDDYILEGVLAGRDWRLFGWNKLRETLMQAAAQVGKTEGDVERDVTKLRQILAPAVKMRYCLEYERNGDKVVCGRYLRAREVAEGLLVEVVAKKAKSVKVAKVALLPRRMAIVRDPYYAEEYYVAYSGGRLLTATPGDDWDGFLTAIRQRPPYYVIGRTGVVDAIKRILPRVETVISAGLTDGGGVADPLGVLDATDYGVEPLIQAYRWVRSSYGEKNAKLAWFNVMAAFVKLFTPLVRVVKRNFVDYIIYNVGRGGEGKSTLARNILTPLLGGAAALETYNIRVDGAVRTEAQMRNLLALNRLPLILDEQTRRALVNNSAILLSAAVGLGTTGIHAAKHGLGVAAKFKNLRGVLVFTNVAFSIFVKEAAVDSSDYALLRRFIELAWDFEPISPEVFRQIPEVKPALGYAARLWQKYRDRFLQAADLLELIEVVTDVMAEEHPGVQEVVEVAEYTKQIVSEIREEKKAERLALRDEDAIVERAYRYVAEELKASQLNAVKVIRHLLENAQRIGIAFSRPRDAEQIRARADDVADVVMRIKNMYVVAPVSEKLAEDATVVVNILNNLLNEGRVNVVVFAKTPLVPGAPRTVMDAPRSVYAVNGVRRHGYSIPLAKFLRIFLDSEPPVEDV
jgi:hypothetical protein